jgi:hypothetical protein
MKRGIFSNKLEDFIVKKDDTFILKNNIEFQESDFSLVDGTDYDPLNNDKFK